MVILDEIERTNGAEIDLDADHYWLIRHDAAFDLGSVPVPQAGQIWDDVDTLRELISERADRQVIVWHDLAHLIGILKRLAALDDPLTRSQ